MDLAYANGLTARTNAVVGRPVKSADEKLKCGLDLGTAYIVLVALDGGDNPVACEMQFASVIRDGLVVDYFGTLDIVKKLKEKVEAGVGRKLGGAAIAMPPGTGANAKTHRYIAESAGFEISGVLDEPSAANAVLGVKNGVVVDIGGGTTGYSVFSDGEVVKTGDEPTGGTHMSLVIAGNKNIPLEEAEAFKQDKNNHGIILPVVRPVIEKMATIVMRGIAGCGVDAIYLCGGACMLGGIDDIFESVCGIPAYIPDNPLLITPLGIALCDR